MKVEVKLVYELDITDWYEDENLTKKEKLERFKEDIYDVSVHCNHCTYKTQTGCEVKLLNK